MAIINEINKGELDAIPGVYMYRIYDSNTGFQTTFKTLNNHTELDIQNNIVVPYIEYFKNENGDRLDSILAPRYKNYIVRNHPAIYKNVTVVDQTATYYVQGETIVPAVYYQVGELMTPATYDENNVEITPAIYCESENTDIKIPATIANGGELKTAEINHIEQQVQQAEWMGANNWFLSLARTPIVAPYGIMDSIESTLASLPQNVPNDYIIPNPNPNNP